MNDKEKLLMDYVRMCLNTHCDDCPLWVLKKEGVSCKKYILDKKDDAIKTIEKWGAEHPVKTRQDEFLERYPNVTTNFNGVIDIDPCKIDTSLLKEGLLKGLCKIVEDCRECRDYYWSQEVTE